MARRIQVYLDEPELKRLEDFARERGWTRSQAVRVAVRALTRHWEKEIDPLLELSGDIDGLPSDLSGHFHRYLTKTGVAERRAPFRARR